MEEEMKKLLMTGAVALVIIGSAATAHPTDEYFDSFGECQAALQQQNKVDRERVAGFFDSLGAAEVSMLDNFRCDYDPEEGAWHFVDLRFQGGGTLGNGNAAAARR
jgi:hypothetical protein